MKRTTVAVAALLWLAAPLSGQTEEELKLRDVAGRALDQAAAANEAAQLLQIKVDEQAGRIAALEAQLAEISRVATANADAKAEQAAAKERAAARKLADEQWAAGAPERARQAAALQAAVDQWRASIKRTPNIIIVANKASGGASVIVDGKSTEFKTVAEAAAFAAAVKQKPLPDVTRDGSTKP